MITISIFWPLGAQRVPKDHPGEPRGAIWEHFGGDLGAVLKTFWCIFYQNCTTIFISLLDASWCEISWSGKFGKHLGNLFWWNLESFESGFGRFVSCVLQILVMVLWMSSVYLSQEFWVIFRCIYSCRMKPLQIYVTSLAAWCCYNAAYAWGVVEVAPQARPKATEIWVHILFQVLWVFTYITSTLSNCYSCQQIPTSNS